MNDKHLAELRERLLDLPKPDKFKATQSIEAELEDVLALFATALAQQDRESRELFHEGFSGKPEKHPIPCQDCGSDYWMDWIVPHPVFNAVCPGGAGYLCLPCFAQRLIGAQNGG